MTAMKRCLFLLAVLALCIVPALSARAQAIDMANLTCTEFAEFNDLQIGILLAWYDGFYSREGGSMQFEPGLLPSLREALDLKCSLNPAARIMDIIDSFFATENS